VNPSTAYSIYPLGDSAITIDLGNCIDEQLNIRALAIHDWLQAHRFPGITDIIIAYSSVSVFYDPTHRRVDSPKHPHGMYNWLRELLKRAWTEAGTASPETPAQNHHFRIPVCYESGYGPDLDWVASQKGLSVNEVIALHHSVTYRIYMIGFLPGFPYMGKIADRLAIARKARPVTVKAGGVGIAGIQTGVYPLNSPGGWQIIGRTPVQLFDRHADPPIHMQTGDSIQFYPITREEFLDWKSPGEQL
jgi:inhibitor of KinA